MDEEIKNKKINNRIKVIKNHLLKKENIIINEQNTKNKENKKKKKNNMKTSELFKNMFQSILDNNCSKLYSS